MTQDLPSVVGEEPESGAASHSPEAVDTLKKAMRRARQDNAERAGVLSELRSASLGRLELLHEALRPLIAQIPADVDTFDIGLMPGVSPRLFIDMIGFVEMGRDARMYRLLQDTRHGRTRIAESEDLDTMVDAVTDYVARRLLERDKALAADARQRVKPPRPGDTPPVARAVATRPPARPPATGPTRWFVIAFAFLIDLLGSIAFFTILAAIGWYLWTRLHTPV